MQIFKQYGGPILSLKNAPWLLLTVAFMAFPTDIILNRLSQEFRYTDLEKATRHWSEELLLGAGSFGTVFRGTLRDGTEVAIKKLRCPKEGGFREEVEVLSRFRHPNLVILMGFARNRGERCLVYELLSGGDVFTRLEKDLAFTWQSRLSVSLDAALGLSHLHGSRPQVFHRDVKTLNILMDKNGTGKVADFGLACLAEPNKRSLEVTNGAGTLGYADPRYIRTGRFSEASEVYSMGMVLLEMLTGRPPCESTPSGDIHYTFDFVVSAHSGRLDLMQAMADRRGHWPPSLVDRVSGLAFACVVEGGRRRPAFVRIVTDLRKLQSRASLYGAAAAAADTAGAGAAAEPRAMSEPPKPRPRKLRPPPLACPAPRRWPPQVPPPQQLLQLLPAPPPDAAGTAEAAGASAAPAASATRAANDTTDQRLYVHGVPVDMSEASLLQIFKQYGRILSLKKVPGDGAAVLLHFQEADDAKRVLDNVHKNIPLGLKAPVTILQERKTPKPQAGLAAATEQVEGPGFGSGDRAAAAGKGNWYSGYGGSWESRDDSWGSMSGGEGGKGGKGGKIDSWSGGWSGKGDSWSSKSNAVKRDNWSGKLSKGVGGGDNGGGSSWQGSWRSWRSGGGSRGSDWSCGGGSWPY